MTQHEPRLLARRSSDGRTVIVEAPITNKTLSIALDPFSPRWWNRWKISRLRARAHREQCYINSTDLYMDNMGDFGVELRND